MPFQKEKAGYAALRRILSSEKLQSLQKRFKRAPSAPDGEGRRQAEIVSHKGDICVPKIIHATDGSYHAAEIDNGYPGAEVGYLTVASVLLFLDKLKAAGREKFIDPVKFRDASDTGSIDMAVPGRGVILDDEPSAKFSMRKVLFEEMKNYRILGGSSESLLDTFEYLQGIHPFSGASLARCPCQKEEKYRPPKKGKHQCANDDCEVVLYSTDALRLHELFSNIESCEKMYGHIMHVAERLLLIQTLRAFEQQGEKWLSLIGKMAFVMDGPLAVYGTSAWMSSSIRKELGRINQVQKAITGRDMLILGIEKSGGFFRHMEMIDADKRGNPGQFPVGGRLLLDNDYIREYIEPSDGGRLYGRNSYFGRKFFYKPGAGHNLVVNIACYDERQMNIETARPDQYPRLEDATSLLREISSSMYPHSISPLIAAHSEASIPMRLGHQILDDMARREITKK